MICLFEESHCSPALLKVPIYSIELVTVIFVRKLQCTKVPATTPFFVGECADLHIHNSNCIYSLSIVTFLEEQF